MKLIHLLPILLVIVLSCLTSCRKEEIPSADNERTLFMYLPWSTNLTSYFYQNIEDMEDAISRRRLDKERVLVFLSTSSTEAELFEITVNNGTCTRQILKEYTRPAFTTEEGLTGILNDMESFAPAKTYSLIVGCTPGVVGCVEASETMKVILGSPYVLSGKLWHIDLRTLESYVISLV